MNKQLLVIAKDCFTNGQLGTGIIIFISLGLDKTYFIVYKVYNISSILSHGKKLTTIQ